MFCFLFYFGESICGRHVSRDSRAPVLRCDRSLTEALGDGRNTCLLTRETLNTYFAVLRGLWEPFVSHLVCWACGAPTSSRTVLSSTLEGTRRISDALFLTGSVFFGVCPTNGSYLVLHKLWFSSVQRSTVF